MVRNKSIHDSVIDRELSPQSSQYITPPAPRGTKRRPVKQLNMTSNSVNQTQTSVDRAFNEETCITHIRSLNPKLNDEPLHALTQLWLRDPNAALPSSADSRIHRHMHKYDTYSLEAGENKVLALVQGLKRGTDIEQLDSAYYTSMESRVVERFKFLSELLLRDRFIEESNGKVSKTKIFQDRWKIKEKYWRDDTQPKVARSHTLEESEFGNESIYDDYGTPPPTKKRIRPSMINQKSPSAPETSNTTNTSSTKSKSSIQENTGANPSHPLHTATSNTTRETHLQGNFSTIGAVSQSTLDAQVMDDDADIMDALDFLNTSAANAVPITPVPREYPPHPITPTSPTLSIATLANEKRNSMTPALCLRSPSMQSESGSSQTATPAASPSKRVDIRINFLSAAGCYNPRTSILAPQLRPLSLQAFFELVADRSGVPLESFDCLTLRYTFFGLNVELIRKDATEDEWKESKDSMSRIYHFSRKRLPNKSDFGIWVDPGDTVTVKTEDNLWDE